MLQEGVKSRAPHGCFCYELYTKPSHSGSVIPWSSHHPKSLLCSILTSEFRRATRNGSGPLAIERGRSIISQRYMANGYPRHIIRRALHRFDHPIQQDKTKKRAYLSLPFLDENSTREIRRAASKYGLSDFLSLTFKSYTLSSLLKPRRPSLCFKSGCKFCLISSSGDNCSRKFVVYLIECRLCPATYIGETARTMRSRLHEHVSSSTSHVFQHLRNAHAEAELEHLTWRILHSGLHSFVLRRKIELTEICSRSPECPLLNVQHVTTSVTHTTVTPDEAEAKRCVK